MLEIRFIKPSKKKFQSFKRNSVTLGKLTLIFIHKKYFSSYPNVFSYVFSSKPLKILK